jgi:hypothetical protein
MRRRRQPKTRTPSGPTLFQARSGLSCPTGSAKSTVSVSSFGTTRPAARSHQTELANGTVVTVVTGRNLLFDPFAGFVLAIGRFNYAFDAEGILIQPLEGIGRLIDICELWREISAISSARGPRRYGWLHVAVRGVLQCTA